MDFRFTEEQEAFRQEIRDFLKANLGEDWRGIDPDAYFHDENWPHIRGLTAKLVEKGWLTLAWPEEYGGQGRPHIEQMIYNEEMAYFRAPTRDVSLGTELVGLPRVRRCENVLKTGHFSSCWQQTLLLQYFRSQERPTVD